ncbi:MAG: hypothetical protein QXU98_07960 [Candidatus Parvarchaeota archaeon]
MLCKNCGHTIIELEGFYFHVYSVRPSLLQIGFNCENEDAIGNICNCIRPEPSIDDAIENLNKALKNTNKLVDTMIEVQRKMNKEGD